MSLMIGRGEGSISGNFSIFFMLVFGLEFGVASMSNLVLTWNEGTSLKVCLVLGLTLWPGDGSMSNLVLLVWDEVMSRLSLP